MEFDFNELRELLTVLNQTDVTELILKVSDFELTLRKGSGDGDRPLIVNAGSVPATALPISMPVAATPAPVQSQPAPTESLSPPPPTPLADKLLEVTSPMVGTFYRSPAPDEPPFVAVGDRIRSGQTVCIIEAMKLMNELDSEVSGEIVEILVENAEPVEFGQVLMRVKPL